MRPKQQRNSMRRRRSERDETLQRDGTMQRSLSLTSVLPRPLSTASIARALSAGQPSLASKQEEGRCTTLRPEVEDGDTSTATSMDSTRSAVLAEGSETPAGSLDPGQLGLPPMAPSPLVPSRSSEGRGFPPALPIPGFDKQANSLSSGSRPSTPESCGDDGEDLLGFPVFPRRVVNWARLPGETSITQSVRLYLEHLDPEATHEDNCEIVLRQVLERVALEELDVQALKMRHKTKVEAFLRSVVLSVPARTWQQSVRGALVRTSSGGSGSKAFENGQQISRDEMAFRMTMFVSIMKAERRGGAEEDASVDSLRVESIVRGYAANAAEILPLQRPARTILPPLLFCMACEMLGVRLLASEVRDVCRQIVADYEARAKVWMSPTQNAERYLQPLVTEFASWVRSNSDVLYQGSATEGLLRNIASRLRTRLKTQVYRSPEHFLSVLESLSPELTDMPLPPYDPAGGDQDNVFDVSQTLKDVSRERFEVNGEPTEPSECWRTIRALMLKAADTGTRVAVDLPQKLGDEGIERLGTTVATEKQACGDAAAGSEVVKDTQHSSGDVVLERPSGLDAYVDECAWRVLHAASRTASGGDSFFVVQDLFGGDGVLVKTATSPTDRIIIRTKGLAARVTTVDKYDIYHTSDVDISSSFSEASPRPLMTITTTMKEIVRFVPYTGCLSSRKSTPLADRLLFDNLQDVASMDPLQAKSSRFITISAGLPDYPDDGIDAPSRRAVSTEAASLLTGAAGLVASETAAPATVAEGNSRHHLRIRPSTFNSPLPASLPAVRKKRN